MGNYKFYTPPLLAECLIKHLPNKEYHNVIDICCGSWNLLSAAKNRFNNANFTGVDNDIEASRNRFKDAKFECLDGRKFADKEKKKYDLVLSNPPFGRLKDSERYFKNSNKAIIKELNNKRYENEMMQANLILSKKGGVLLFILPVTFFEGESYLAIRKSLCSRYTIESIIKLPQETFGSKKINSCALVMKNIGGQCKRAILKEAICQNNNWRISHCRYISIRRMISGQWISETHEQKKKTGINIYRGNISTANMSDAGSLVLHNSSKLVNGVWTPSVRYCDDDNKLLSAKSASPGDIIVNRIGRYARYWCVCQIEAYVSDCLIVIKASDLPFVRDRLNDNTTEGRLNILTKGVTTRYVTIKDIYGLLI